MAFPIRSRWRVRSIGRAAPRKPWGGSRTRARSTKTAAHYPTAYYGQLARARLGLDEVTLRALPRASAEHRTLEIARAFEILYAVDERDLVAIMAADLGDKATDTAALAALADIATRHNDARATLLIGKAMLGRGYPFERYAFPDFGVPNYQQIGPAVEPCVVYSIVRQESAFNPHVVSSANAYGLMQVTPDAGRDTAKRFNVTFNQRRLADDVAYNAQLGTAELGNDLASWRGSYILAFVSYNAGPRRAREWIEQYGDPRDSQGRSDRLDRAHPDLGNAQLRRARDREHAGLSRARRKQSQAIDRSRSAPRRVAFSLDASAPNCPPLRQNSTLPGSAQGSAVGAKSLRRHA